MAPKESFGGVETGTSQAAPTPTDLRGAGVSPAEVLRPGAAFPLVNVHAGFSAAGPNSALFSPADAADLPAQTEGQDKFDAFNAGFALSSIPGGGSAAAGGAVQIIDPLQLPLLVARVLAEGGASQAQGRTHLRFRLEPEHLGEVVVRLVYRSGEVSAHFLTSSTQAREVLESSLPQLREALAGQNLHLQNVSVSVGQEGGYLPREDYRPAGQHYPRWEGNGGSPGDEGESAATEQRADLLRTGVNLFV
ncbi:MAG: flagellar hook-length control protein FliK [Moorella sp. (in: Bacteria)]|nr:flagellar hook-length control protein FliK [Moorella sp. (in: firmicutes)]